jgi:hypothetical protein
MLQLTANPAVGAAFATGAVTETALLALLVAWSSSVTINWTVYVPALL